MQNPPTALDDTVTVPIVWLFVVAGALLIAFFWWLRTEWARNWKEHEAFNKRIDFHHTQIDNHITRIHKRIDHMIHYGGIPAYPGDEDEDK